MTQGRSDGPAKIDLKIDLGSGAEAGEVAEATLQLRRELLDLDLEAVETVRGGAPPTGTRAIDFAALGTLVVTIANPALLSVVVGAVQSWLGGRPKRSIKLQLGGDVLELSGISSEEQRRVTNAWLRRHVSR